MPGRAADPATHSPLQTRVFESELSGSRQQVWDWVTDVQCLRREMRPFIFMTAPRGVRRLRDLDPRPGKPLFVSVILLFGILPVDYSRLTLHAIEEGHGFREQSPMGSMRHWSHSRQLLVNPRRAGMVVLRDTLCFEPRFAVRPTVWFVERFFSHRHAVLRRSFNGAAPRAG